MPVYFIGLDGKYLDIRRKRQTTILAYNTEEVVYTDRLAIPTSHHPIDSINLKDPRFGIPTARKMAKAAWCRALTKAPFWCNGARRRNTRAIWR